jgi:hypothetical protein
MRIADCGIERRSLERTEDSSSVSQASAAFGDPQSAFPSPVGFRRTGFFVSVHLHSWFLLFVPSLRLK